MSLVDDAKSWWAQPLNPKGSVWNWFGFTGLVLVMIILWSTVLRLIAERDK